MMVIVGERREKRPVDGWMEGWMVGWAGVVSFVICFGQVLTMTGLDIVFSIPLLD